MNFCCVKHWAPGITSGLHTVYCGQRAEIEDVTEVKSYTPDDEDDVVCCCCLFAHFCFSTCFSKKVINPWTKVSAQCNNQIALSPTLSCGSLTEERICMACAELVSKK